MTTTTIDEMRVGSKLAPVVRRIVAAHLTRRFFDGGGELLTVDEFAARGAAGTLPADLEVAYAATARFL